MVEEYNLSFLNLDSIKDILLQSQSDIHGLLTNGRSSYNVGMPILMYPKLKPLYAILKQYVRMYCNKHDIPKVKFINSWFNITNPGSELKAHNHPQSIISGAFYLSGKTPLIFPDTKVEPYPGLLVIFPSDMVHYTKEEQEQRIVISFNTDYS